MKTALIFFFASLIPAVACELDGPYGNVKVTENEHLFFDFQFAMNEEEVDEYVATYNSQPKLIQDLVKVARFESESIHLGENKTVRDLVSDVDYISIYDISYDLSSGPEQLYLVVIGVGGGNGAYMYFKKVETEDGVVFKKLYEDFDGDVYFCAAGY